MHAPSRLTFVHLLPCTCRESAAAAAVAAASIAAQQQRQRQRQQQLLDQQAAESDEEAAEQRSVEQRVWDDAGDRAAADAATMMRVADAVAASMGLSSATEAPASPRWGRNEGEGRMVG
jgi:hypothetical protein